MSHRVVIDTNVLVAALRSEDGASRQVLRLCLQGKCEPLIGQKLFFEFLDVVGRPAMFASSPATAEEREELFHGFLAVCRWQDIFFLWRPNLTDEGDNHLVELAVAGGAEFVVTHNTADFAQAELKFQTKVLTPAQFLKTLR